MAATAGGRQGSSSSKKQAAADEELDPKYEWQENDKSFILLIHLSGFRKQDFRVQVDGTGRLTVSGQRADADTNAKHSRFSKVFQLPSTSNLDGIAGRFEAGVLTLTVPKRPPPPGIKIQPAKQQQEVQDEAKAKEDDAKPKAAKEEDAATSRMPATEQVADAKRDRPEQEQPKAAAPPAATKEEGKPKAGDAPAAPVATDSKQATPTAGDAAAATVVTDRKQATPKPEPPPQADAERKAVDPESLAERVKRRAEEEKAAAAAAAEEAERQRKRKACRGFKERVAEELQGLAGSEWAEGLVDTVKRNKEVIATAVAAFSLGLFVSSRLFSRSSN